MQHRYQGGGTPVPPCLLYSCLCRSAASAATLGQHKLNIRAAPERQATLDTIGEGALGQRHKEQAPCVREISVVLKHHAAMAGSSNLKSISIDFAMSLSDLQWC